ncbi:hypothetical protein BJ742DRAFT_810733, partial [Cladochytrium replicatum]
MAQVVNALLMNRYRQQHQLNHFHHRNTAHPHTQSQQANSRWTVAAAASAVAATLPATTTTSPPPTSSRDLEFQVHTHTVPSVGGKRDRDDEGVCMMDTGDCRFKRMRICEEAAWITEPKRNNNKRSLHEDEEGAMDNGTVKRARTDSGGEANRFILSRQEQNPFMNTSAIAVLGGEEDIDLDVEDTIYTDGAMVEQQQQQQQGLCSDEESESARSASQGAMVRYKGKRAETQTTWTLVDYGVGIPRWVSSGGHEWGDASGDMGRAVTKYQRRPIGSSCMIEQLEDDEEERGKEVGWIAADKVTVVDECEREYEYDDMMV